MRRTAPFVVALGLVLVAERAWAVCSRPDLLDAVPPDGSKNVPLNASLFARYRVNADYQDEPITLTHNGSDETLTGTWDAAELLLSVSPTLEPNTDYTIVWPRLRGVNSASLGRNKTVHFSVGASQDLLPPDFAGLTDITWDVDREKDDCTDNLEDRYTFDFELGHADDDGGRSSLMLVVFQTRGPYVDSASPKPVLVHRIPNPGDTIRLTETIADGDGDVCFAGIVRDLTGQPSASGSRQICVKTVEPPFFNGCSTNRRGGSGTPLALFAGVVGFAFLRRRRIG